MNKTLRPGLLILSLFIFAPSYLFAKTVGCPPKPALLSEDNPVYTEAMALAEKLQQRGFVVQCMFPSKLGSIFEVDDGGTRHSTVEGEAAYRTNLGDFDVAFMPKPQTFAGFNVTERRVGNGYLYTFTGVPRVWAANKFGSAYRTYFLKHGNELFNRRRSGSGASRAGTQHIAYSIVEFQHNF